MSSFNEPPIQAPDTKGYVCCSRRFSLVDDELVRTGMPYSYSKACGCHDLTIRVFGQDVPIRLDRVSKLYLRRPR